MGNVNVSDVLVAALSLGHAQYDSQFGFEPSVRFGFRSVYTVPDDVFQALELRPGCLRGASGEVRYHPCLRCARLTVTSHLR